MAEGELPTFLWMVPHLCMCGPHQLDFGDLFKIKEKQYCVWDRDALRVFQEELEGVSWGTFDHNTLYIFMKFLKDKC